MIGTTADRKPARAGRLGRRLLSQQELAPLIAIVILFLVFEFRSG